MNLEVLTPLIVAVLGYVGWYGRKWVLAHVTPTQLAALSGLAQQAVNAAEQLGAATGIKGADKFEVASNALVESAKRLGVSLKPDEVQSFIHSAVADLKAAQQYAALNLP